MTKKLEIYKCNKCGNIVEVLNEQGAPLVCCGEKMELKEEKTADTSTEKHVPYIEELENGYKVRIGENQKHPMTDEHFIQWIELIANNKVYRQELKPNEAPEAIFNIEKTDQVVAREYCNIHGLWKGNL